MSSSHTLTHVEEREREEDLHKQEVRGEVFQNRLKTISNLAVAKGNSKELIREWVKDMKRTFVRRGEAVWELYHDEGWEKVGKMLDRMQNALIDGKDIVSFPIHISGRERC